MENPKQLSFNVHGKNCEEYLDPDLLNHWRGPMLKKKHFFQVALSSQIVLQ